MTAQRRLANDNKVINHHRKTRLSNTSLKSKNNVNFNTVTSIIILFIEGKWLDLYEV